MKNDELEGERASLSLTELLIPAGVGTFLFCATFLLYARAVSFPFTFEDIEEVVRNPLFRTPSLFFEYLRLATSIHGFQPLTGLINILSFWIFGTTPQLHHALHITLYSLMCVVLLQLLTKLTSPRLALTATLLFMLHPAHIELVLALHSRGILLSSLFGMMSLCVLLQRKEEESPSHLKPALGGTFLFLSCCSWEGGLLFFGLFLLLSYLKSETLAVRPALFGVIWTVGGVFLYMAVRLFFLENSTFQLPEPSFVNNPLASLSFFDRIGPAAITAGNYLLLLVNPTSLNKDYSYAQVFGPSQHTYSLWPLGAVALLGSILIFTFRQRREGAIFSSWTFFSLLPFSHLFFPLPRYFLEDLSLLPSIGICGLIAMVLEFFATPFLRLSLLAVYGSFLVSFHWITLNERVRPDEFVYLKYAHSPRSIVSILRVARFSLEKGRPKEALTFTEQALTLYPSSPEALSIKGRALFLSGKAKEGESNLNQALQLDPFQVEALTTLGEQRLRAGRLPEAGQYFEKALAKDPTALPALLGKLEVSIKQKRVQESFTLYDELLTREQSSKRLTELGELLKKTLRDPPTPSSSSSQ